LSFGFGLLGAELMQLNRGVELFEMDGDGAFGQSMRQRANAGEGFRRKNDALAFAIGVAETAMEATGEDSAQDGILAAVAGAEGGVVFVEEEGGALLGVYGCGCSEYWRRSWR